MFQKLNTLDILFRSPVPWGGGGAGGGGGARIFSDNLPTELSDPMLTRSKANLSAPEKILSKPV